MGRALLVQGLGFGDEGKGGICDFLTRQHHSPLTVRFGGGAQASHAVVTDDGKDHRFSQFGAGTFAGARTFLSRFMLFNPVALAAEARHLIEQGVPDPYKLLTVDRFAWMTTPFHVAANRIREMARRGDRHGSCGMGIGETMDYVIRHPLEAPMVRDLMRPTVLTDKLALLAHRLRADVVKLVDPAVPAMALEWEILCEFKDTMTACEAHFTRVREQVELVDSDWLDYELGKDQTVVFEGAQGVLLDESFGFHPHTTWSTTTFENALILAKETSEVRKIGVLRGYMTRHGAGPFVTEDPSIPVPEGEHNAQGPWQGGFRMGHFDMVMARYALDAVGGCDELALTCLDHLRGPIKTACEYQLRTSDSRCTRLPFNKVAPRIIPGSTGFNAAYDEHLAKQESLTNQLLTNVKPVYEEFPNVVSFVEGVEKATSTPVGILSFGPKASEKRAR